MIPSSPGSGGLQPRSATGHGPGGMPFVARARMAATRVRKAACSKVRDTSTYMLLVPSSMSRILDAPDCVLTYCGVTFPQHNRLCLKFRQAIIVVSHGL